MLLHNRTEHETRRQPLLACCLFCLGSPLLPVQTLVLSAQGGPQLHHAILMRPTFLGASNEAQNFRTLT